MTSLGRGSPAFLVVERPTKDDQEWRPGAEFGVIWDDPDLAIPWKRIGPPILSERDTSLPRVREIFPDKFS